MDDVELLKFAKDNLEVAFAWDWFPQRLVAMLLKPNRENQCNALLLVSQYANNHGQDSVLCSHIVDAVLLCVDNGGSKLVQNCAVGTLSALVGSNNNAMDRQESAPRCFRTLVQFIQQSKDNHARHCGFAVLNLLLTHIDACDYMEFFLSQLNNNKDELGKVYTVKLMFALCKRSTTTAAVDIISNAQFKPTLSKLVKSDRVVGHPHKYSGKSVAFQLVGALVESQPDLFIQHWKDFVDNVLLRSVIEYNDSQALVLLFRLVEASACAREYLFTRTKFVEWLIAQSQKDGDGHCVRLLAAICICDANRLSALGFNGVIPVLVKCNMHAELAHWHSLLRANSSIVFSTRMWANLARFWAFLCGKHLKMKKKICAVQRLPQELVRCVFEML